MINEAITKVANGNNLGEKEMTDAMELMLSGMATPAQIGAFITALRMKGETLEEIVGAAKAMRARTKKIRSMRLWLISIAMKSMSKRKQSSIPTATEQMAPIPLTFRRPQRW